MKSILITVLPYLIGLGLIGVVITLFRGVATLGGGEGEAGQARRRQSNRLMIMRVVFQGVTVALFLLYIALLRWI